MTISGVLDARCHLQRCRLQRGTKGKPILPPTQHHSFFRNYKSLNQFGRTYHTGATISIRLNRALRYKRAVIFVQFIRLTSEYSRSRRLLLDMDSYYCLFCAEEVISRQEALLCDGCDRWQHRRCQTCITRKSTERLFGDASIAAQVQPQSLKVQDSATKIWTP